MTESTPEKIHDLRAAALARLRFETAMGVEFAAPVALQRKAPAPASVAVAAPAVVAMREASAPPPAAANSDEIAARWKALEARAMGCVSCVLHKGRTNVVFGVGNRAAQLVFVGEAPGFDEDQRGEPSVGRAGQLLDRIMGAMKWKREDVYICNVVKCRPPDNRKPLPDEMDACSPFLREQLELLAPKMKVIVALGGVAASALLKTSAGIMSIRGKWSTYKNIPVMPTYHPAFLLRSYTEENRRNVWEDMKKVADRLNGEERV